MAWVARSTVRSAFHHSIILVVFVGATALAATETSGGDARFRSGWPSSEPVIAKAQLQNLRLSPEAGSEAEGFEVSLIIDAEGRQSILVELRLRLGLFVNGPRFWFVDRLARTYKAIALTGDTEADVARLEAEYVRRGKSVPVERLRFKVSRAWDSHEAWLKPREPRFTRWPASNVTQTAKELMRLVTPDGGGPSAHRTSDYCYGEHEFDMLWEDPVYIDVSRTLWDFEFSGWDSFTFDSPNCWAKSAYGWPPFIVDTQWYVDECSLLGWSGGGGIDKYVFSVYHNDDWRDPQQTTNTFASGGLQYTNWINPNIWEQHSADGEDAGWLEYTSQSSGWYICIQ